jgi:hypothetical protein
MPGIPNVKPARMSLTSMNTGQTMKAQFNPTEFEESLEAHWGKLAVLGLSHMPQQYQYTDNHAFSIELAFRAYDGPHNKQQQILAMRRFLFSLMYSSRGNVGADSSEGAGGAPTRVLFVWPTLVSLTATIKKIKIKHSLFSPAATPTQFAATVDLEEIRDVRLYAEDVLQMGTQRSGEQNQIEFD